MLDFINHLFNRNIFSSAPIATGFKKDSIGRIKKREFLGQSH